MRDAAIFLIVAGFGVLSVSLAMAAASRASGWAERRYLRDAEKNRQAMRLIPKSQLTSIFVAWALGVSALLVWVWTDGWMKSVSAVVGLAALVYIGWFSRRWRHLR